MVKVRRRLFASAVVGMLVLTLSSCGGSGSSASKSQRSTTTKATTTTTAPPDSAALAQLLVGIDGVPSGYSQQAPAGPEDSTDDIRICGGAQLQEILASPSLANVAYTGGTFGPVLSEYLSAFPNEEAAQTVLDAARKQLSTCTEFSQTDPDGTKYNYTIGALATGQFGDDRAAARVKAVLEGGYISFDIEFTRTGSIIVSTLGASVTSIFGGGQVQPGQFDAFTAAAVKKVDARNEK